jgi:transcriptional regulator with XRE-family HTH domain
LALAPAIGSVVTVHGSEYSVGVTLRTWRARRRLSQLSVSVETGVSTRHLSCVETGRSRPSRELLLMLAEHLDMPLGDRNQLLLAGGFAPVYSHVEIDAVELAPLRDQFKRLMTAHEPNPALLVDRSWNVVEANRAAVLLFDGVAEHLLEPPVNTLRLAFHPDGLPRISTGPSRCSRDLLRRLREDVEGSIDPAMTGLVEEIESYLPELTGPVTSPDSVLNTFELKTCLGGIRLFTVIATLASPTEVTSSGLKLETFLPADYESARLLEELGTQPADHRSVQATP